jgi:hypothetical protein
MKRERITRSRDKDAWVSRWKRSGDGFFTCDKDGVEVEPDEHWTTDCYVCNSCGRMIDYNTLEVVGKAVIPKGTVI